LIPRVLGLGSSYHPEEFLFHPEAAEGSRLVCARGSFGGLRMKGPSGRVTDRSVSAVGLYESMRGLSSSRQELRLRLWRFRGGLRLVALHRCQLGGAVLQPKGGEETHERDHAYAKEGLLVAYRATAV
jgi:hypothetical protein